MTNPIRLITDVEYLVLQGLAQKPIHGYGLKKAVEDLTNGEVKLSLATLYDTLHRLLDNGLIRRLPDEEVEGRLRRSYHVTPNGEAAVAEKNRMLSQMLKAGRVALLPSK